MTDAEKAALDAAEMLFETGVQPMVFDRFNDAMRALRESRKPKPKWRLDNGAGRLAVFGPDNQNFQLYHRGDYAKFDEVQRVLDLLNKADPA